jgi:hypothetical protein
VGGQRGGRRRRGEVGKHCEVKAELREVTSGPDGGRWRLSLGRSPRRMRRQIGGRGSTATLRRMKTAARWRWTRQLVGGAWREKQRSDGGKAKW